MRLSNRLRFLEEKLPGYALVEELGSGGMGSVYKARDRQGRTVAIKVLNRLDHESLRRFHREAKAARLDHPNIVTIYGLELADNGLPFVVQEFLDGENLAQVISKARKGSDIKFNIKIGFLEQLAQGISYAHKEKVIHRDLTPRNLMIVKGRLKILDFGLARILSDSSGGSPLTGPSLGTFGYAAPEQLGFADRSNEKSDVFSFGVIAYEFITLLRPFSRLTEEEFIRTLEKKSFRELDEVAPWCPRKMKELISQCLEVDPDDRPSGAHVLVSELRSIKSYLKRKKPTRRTRRGGRR